MPIQTSLLHLCSTKFLTCFSSSGVDVMKSRVRGGRLKTFLSFKTVRNSRRPTKPSLQWKLCFVGGGESVGPCTWPLSSIYCRRWQGQLYLHYQIRHKQQVLFHSAVIKYLNSDTLQLFHSGKNTLRHVKTFNWISQQDAATSQVDYLSFYGHFMGTSCVGSFL